MEYAPYLALAVLVVGLAIWVAYKLFRYFAKKALFLAYIAIAFVALLMGVAGYIYYRYLSQ